MESANIVSSKRIPTQKRDDQVRSEVSSITASSLWITTSTMLFDSDWKITFSSHTDTASPTIRSLESEGRGLLKLLGELSPQITSLDKKAIVQSIEPFSTQFGTWDQNSFRNYRLHIFANTEGGICRLEARIPQPERIPPVAPLSIPATEIPTFKRSVVPKTTHDWIQAIDELWPAVAFVQAQDFSLITASESLFHFTGRSPKEFSEDPSLFWKVIHESDHDLVKQAPHNTPSTQKTNSNRFRVRHLDLK